MSKYTENFPNLSTYDFDTIMCQLKQVCGADPSGMINAQFLSRPTTAKDIALLLHITYQLFQSQVELQKQFVELYTFVKDFFENLDLQEEVNKWLDEAYESGKLMTLFEKFIPYVTPEMYGAIGDGIIDDSNALINCFNSKRPVYLSKSYLSDSDINVYNNIFGNGKIIRKLNELTNYNILKVLSPCEIKDITIEDKNTKTLIGEWGMGINIESSDVSIYDTTIFNCYGDCIYVGGETKSNNIRIHNNHLYGWRRNAISLINGENISIFNNIIHDGGVTAPFDGIDVEPNNPGEFVTCVIGYNKFFNCVKCVDAFFKDALTDSSKVVLISNYMEGGKNNNVYSFRNNSETEMELYSLENMLDGNEDITNINVVSLTSKIKYYIDDTFVNGNKIQLITNDAIGTVKIKSYKDIKLSGQNSAFIFKEFFVNKKVIDANVMTLSGGRVRNNVFINYDNNIYDFNLSMSGSTYVFSPPEGVTVLGAFVTTLNGTISALNYIVSGNNTLNVILKNTENNQVENDFDIFFIY